jgi:hypothetical protein
LKTVLGTPEKKRAFQYALGIISATTIVDRVRRNLMASWFTDPEILTWLGG